MSPSFKKEMGIFSRFPPVISQVPDARRCALRLERCRCSRETSFGKEGCFSAGRDSGAVPGPTSSSGVWPFRDRICLRQAAGRTSDGGAFVSRRDCGFLSVGAAGGSEAAVAAARSERGIPGEPAVRVATSD